MSSVYMSAGGAINSYSGTRTETERPQQFHWSAAGMGELFESTTTALHTGFQPNLGSVVSVQFFVKNVIGRVQYKVDQH